MQLTLVLSTPQGSTDWETEKINLGKTKRAEQRKRKREEKNLKNKENNVNHKNKLLTVSDIRVAPEIPKTPQTPLKPLVYSTTTLAVTPGPNKEPSRAQKMLLRALKTKIQ